MFLHKGKEYYPLEINCILNREKNEIYNRDLRKKAYVYIAVESEKEQTNG